MRATILVWIASATSALAQPAPSRQEIDNVAAFARLYGVVRYFYPSDAAAALDWNRFAVYGVSKVRGAPNAAALEKTLEELFMPLGPGIQLGASLSTAPAVGARDASLVAWRYRGAGLSGGVMRGPYSQKRTNRGATTSDETAVVSQFLKADSLRGKTIRLRGRMRAATPSATAWAGLWLRVDRSGPQRVGFFDNMQNRPVRDTAWREYVIEGPIAVDATSIALGALAVGAMSFDVDGLDLAVRADSGAWTPVVLDDAGFEADANSRWSQSSGDSFLRIAEGAAEGRRFLRVTVGLATRVMLPEEWEIPNAGAFIDVELTPRLKARVPLALSDSQSAVMSAGMSALKSAVMSAPMSAVRSDSDIRAADVVVAWNVFRHFYPYWPETGVDWDARLPLQIAIALRADGTRAAHRNVLRALVADARDGHGSVTDIGQPSRLGIIPIQARLVAGKLVVIASAVPEARVGAEVTAIDGVNAAERIATETSLSSGAPQWQPWRAMRDILSCVHGSVVKLTLEYPLEPTREAALTCAGNQPSTERRPDSIAELEPGVWYIDLTRTNAAQLQDRLATLAAAKGVVFDVRGYPTDAGIFILPHLLDVAESDKWMHVSKIVGPFGQISAWDSMGWNLAPKSPRIAGNRVFLTDGRAISYAESVMGYVGDKKLATIIGGPTAGTNGNIVNFAVPGGFNIVFTGMRVTRHDGRSPFHIEGVTPDIPLEPTLLSLREGRDLLLERALTMLRARSIPKGD